MRDATRGDDEAEDCTNAALPQASRPPAPLSYERQDRSIRMPDEATPAAVFGTIVAVCLLLFLTVIAALTGSYAVSSMLPVLLIPAMVVALVVVALVLRRNRRPRVFTSAFGSASAFRCSGQDSAF